MSKIRKIPGRRFWLILFGCVFCAVIISVSGLIGAENQSQAQGATTQRVRVLSADNSRLSPDPNVDGLLLGRQTVEVEILTGEHRGQHVRFENTLSRFFNHQAREGMELLVLVNDADGRVVQVEVLGHSRHIFIYVFIALFIAILIAVGRKKGLYSAISLLFTLCVVVFGMIPQILRGHSPVAMAVIAAALSAIFNIFVVSDISLKSLAAVLGTVAGIAIAGAVSVAAGSIAHISGLNLEHAQELFYRAEDRIIGIADLLFAGIIISALGAVIDVGMSVSSSVFNIKRLNPKMNMKKLYQGGMSAGRETIGATSNTLILAFAGSSVAVMVILALYSLPHIHLMNLDLFAIEVIRGISAGIALVLTLPVTALLASLLASENKITSILRRVRS